MRKSIAFILLIFQISLNTNCKSSRPVVGLYQELAYLDPVAKLSTKELDQSTNLQDYLKAEIIKSSISKIEADKKLIKDILSEGKIEDLKELNKILEQDVKKKKAEEEKKKAEEARKKATEPKK